MLIVSKSCVYPRLNGVTLSFYVPLKLFDLVEGKKSTLSISVALTEGSLRLLNFGLSPRTEFARFTCLLESKSGTISPTTLLTPYFSMHDRFEFLDWVVDP